MDRNVVGSIFRMHADEGTGQRSWKGAEKSRGQAGQDKPILEPAA